MLKELMSLFKSDDAIAKMGADFAAMLDRSRELTMMAGSLFFEGDQSTTARRAILKGDTKINKMERKIRKQVIAHVTLQSRSGQAPYCMLLMSLVKDVERIGDYAKNIAEIYDEGGGPLPDDATTDELREIRRNVEAVFEEVGPVFLESNLQGAVRLVERAKDAAKRCDRLLTRIADGPYDAATTVTLVLGTRYYKRIAAHLLNVLSGVVMPLHKLDYYDEDYVEELMERDADEEE